MFANGQAVRRASLVNTTASTYFSLSDLFFLFDRCLTFRSADVTRLYTQPSHSLTFARVVRRLSAGWTL